MQTLRVIVRDKIATYRNRDGVIVCGNNDYYKIAFKFDAEWDIHTKKTARFIFGGRYIDREVINDECVVPVISDATKVLVGVYAGDLWTTTPATIPCRRSILCGTPGAADDKIPEYRDAAQRAAEEAKAAAAEAKRAAASVVNPTIDVKDIEGGHRITIHDADGDKTFDVMDGKQSEVPPEVQQAVEAAQKAAEEAKAAAATIVNPTIDVEETTEGYKLTINDANGETAIGIKNGEGGLTAEQLDDFNDMVKWYKEQTYKAMTGTFTASPSAGLYEMRKAAHFFDVDFSYSFTKAPRVVTFSTNGVAETQPLPEKDETVTKTVTLGSETATKFTYKLYGEYYDAELKKTDKVEKTLAFQFCNRRYYGYAAQPDKVDSAFVRSLTNELVTSRSHSFKSTCGADEYIWCAYPTRLGAATMKMGNYQGGFEAPQTVSVTNQYGVTEAYYVYRSMYKGFKDDYIYVT